MKSCITQFILTNAPEVRLNESDLILIEENQLPSSTSNNSDSNNSENDNIGNPFLTSIALSIGGVQSESWEQKEYINQFYHNVLAHFIFIYLNINEPILNQIDDIIYAINHDQIQEVVDRLKRRKQQLSANLQENDARLIVTNAANANNLGGAVTYKRGTVEEALCRKSNLFLEMLLLHATGTYQKNILLELMMMFKNMLQTQQAPINTREECDKLAETWLKLVYKTSHDGYHINADHFHEHTEILFIDTNQLPTIADLANPNRHLQYSFFNACRVATVIDIVSPDLRSQTKALKFFGLQETEQDASFDTIMKLLSTSIAPFAETKPCMLAMVPLGCGAFGNKIEDFWAALANNMNALTSTSSLSLVIRDDNCFKFIKLSNGMNAGITYDITWKTVENMWLHCWKTRNTTDISLIMNFINANIHSFPQDKVSKFCAEELKQAYRLLQSNDVVGFKTLMQFCGILMGNHFKVYQSLLFAVEKAIFHYDKHTGMQGYFTNAVQGENPFFIQLRELYKNLYEHANITEQGIANFLYVANSIIKEKQTNHPDRQPPSLLDKSFHLLQDELYKLEREFKIYMPSLHKPAATQRLLSSVFPGVLPSNVARQIANDLSGEDMQNLSLTRKK